jgi:acetylornithine/succinyldiaminopimelate/putrescine aminotransferase
LYDIQGKKYLDLISGIAVNNIGHSNQEFISAVKQQLEYHSHVMVYGEFQQETQNQLAKKLVSLLPTELNSVYLVNSGSEAVEGALKLARNYTKRTEIMSFNNAYHGSTFGALSVIGNDIYKKPFEPLLPDVANIEFNNLSDLVRITEKTACVIVETIQGEAGVIEPQNNYLQHLRKKCSEVGALLILDEVQTGFGRTGRFFGFENYDVVPDIAVFAKAMGGGMPIGAFVSNKKIMDVLSTDPPLGHITTFGGHPVSCAAALSNIKILEKNDLISASNQKGMQFISRLQHPMIKELRGRGLMLAVEMEDSATAKSVINKCLNNGLVTDWFLFADNSIRIAPPLTISEEQIDYACDILLKSIEETKRKIA